MMAAFFLLYNRKNDSAYFNNLQNAFNIYIKTKALSNGL